MIATIQATLYNAHFRGQHDAEFLPGDFMGTEDRAKRQAKLTAQRQRDQAELAMLNAKLLLMKPNQEPPDLPEWARR